MTEFNAVGYVLGVADLFLPWLAVRFGRVCGFVGGGDPLERELEIGEGVDEEEGEDCQGVHSNISMMCWKIRDRIIRVICNIIGIVECLRTTILSCTRRGSVTVSTRRRRRGRNKPEKHMCYPGRHRL